MAHEWHFTQNGQPAISPVSWGQLKQLAAEGKLQPTDTVWQDGMTGWLPAASVKGLFHPSKLPPPTPPKKDKDAVKKSGQMPMLAPAEKRPGGGLAELHPLLVLLLAALTLGVFGLVYAFRISAAYTARAAVRRTDAAGRTLGRARHPIAVLLLSYFTGGFYFAYWTYRTMQECSVYSGGRDYASRSELTLMLLVPGYAIYAALFRLPDLVKAVRKTAGAAEWGALSAVPIFIVPCMWLWLPYLAMLYQDALNQVWFTAP
ncbi:MAG TPA: GYF domain-containing protein [Gemmataceae bacterium]|nr:GYF domain-containing protein [Gemmataceae bacterium]